VEGGIGVTPVLPHAFEFFLNFAKEGAGRGGKEGTGKGKRPRIRFLARCVTSSGGLGKRKGGRKESQHNNGVCLKIYSICSSVGGKQPGGMGENEKKKKEEGESITMPLLHQALCPSSSAQIEKGNEGGGRRGKRMKKPLNEFDSLAERAHLTGKKKKTCSTATPARRKFRLVVIPGKE